MPTKAPAKKKPVSKAASATKRKSVAKKVTAKKSSVKKTVASKKKRNPLKRLLEYKISGSVTKKGFFISMAVVIVAVGAFAIYSIAQGNTSNAGGTSTLGRGWAAVGYVGAKGSSGKVTLVAEACSLPAGTGYRVKVRGVVTASTSSNLYVDVNIGTNGGNFYTTPNIRAVVGNTGTSGYSQIYSKTATLYVNGGPAGSFIGQSSNGTVTVKIPTLPTC
jgi:hypothetical protein